MRVKQLRNIQQSLKKLYDKAHSNRDNKTRAEDLLRRYYDGLLDEKARFHIEFIKEPADIDEAVYYTVCFQETRQRKNKHYTDNIRATERSTDSDSDDESTSTARAVPGKNKHKVIRQDRDTNTTNTTETDKLDAEKVLQIVRSELKTSFDTAQRQRQAEQRVPYTEYGYQNRYYGNNTQNKGCFIAGKGSL